MNSKTGQPAAEYTSLVAEILAWQQIRLTLLGFCFALVGAVLVSDAASKQPWLITTLILGVLLPANLITWYAAQGNMIIAAYIQV